VISRQLLLRGARAVVAPKRLEELPGATDLLVGEAIPGQQRADGTAGGPAEADDLEPPARTLVAEEALEHAGRKRRVAPGALTGDVIRLRSLADATARACPQPSIRGHDRRHGEP
jgi:hypothetical protein